MPEQLHNPPGLNIVVALASEAKPLVDRYRLTRQSVSGVNWFVGQVDDPYQTPVNLLVAGIGATAMASAVGWLAATTRGRPTVWLNIGSAGHASRKIGEIVRIACSDAQGDLRSYYVPLTAAWSGQLEPCITVIEPIDDYQFDGVLDMEAYWFFNSASRFASAELVQSLKVISDNQEQDFRNLTAAGIRTLIEARMEQVEAFVDALLGLARRGLPNVAPLPIADVVADRHCTVNQRQQLSSVLVKLAALHVEPAQILTSTSALKSTSEILSELRKILAQQVPELSADGQVQRSGEAND